MTALREYQRLECPGLWRETPDAQRREVIVTFGDATLILKESPSERALSHWSLPALVRANPGQMPAVFLPGPDSGEELEIDDDTMIAAITKVHAIIAARKPHPGRLRGALVLSAVAVMAAAGLLWLPGALIRHTAQVLPQSTRTDIGEAILSDVQRLTGSPCNAPDGAVALKALGDKLTDGHGRVVVVPEGLQTTLHLPGDIIVIGQSLISSYDTPEVAAGFILAERLRSEASDNLPDTLRYAGLRAAFSLLTSGTLPAGAFHGYAEQLLQATAAPVDPEKLIQRFENAGVGSTAYAYAVDKTGESTLNLIEADPFGSEPPPFPLLNDTDWVALQGICGG